MIDGRKIFLSIVWRKIINVFIKKNYKEIMITFL